MVLAKKKHLYISSFNHEKISYSCISFDSPSFIHTISVVGVCCKKDS
jgi:hypothetical protein